MWPLSPAFCHLHVFFAGTCCSLTTATLSVEHTGAWPASAALNLCRLHTTHILEEDETQSLDMVIDTPSLIGNAKSPWLRRGGGGAARSGGGNTDSPKVCPVNSKWKEA